MSIASDYAKKVEASRPVLLINDSTYAKVTAAGDLHMLRAVLTPAEALKLAEWIQRTFGEGGHD